MFNPLPLPASLSPPLFRIFGLAVTMALAPLWASASLQTWRYGDWSVHVEAYDTGEDLRVTCTARTGGDGAPVIWLSISNGDAGPPEVFPQVTITERAPRPYPTLLQNGAPVALEIPGVSPFYALAEAGLDQDGIALAQAQSRWQDALAVLKAMQAGQRLQISALSAALPPQPLTSASLAGFTAAYGKMMDSCGHSLEMFQVEMDFN